MRIEDWFNQMLPDSQMLNNKCVKGPYEHLFVTELSIFTILTETSCTRLPALMIILQSPSNKDSHSFSASRSYVFNIQPSSPLTTPVHVMFTSLAERFVADRHHSLSEWMWGVKQHLWFAHSPPWVNTDEYLLLLILFSLRSSTQPSLLQPLFPITVVQTVS